MLAGQIPDFRLDPACDQSATNAPIGSFAERDQYSREIHQQAQAAMKAGMSRPQSNWAPPEPSLPWLRHLGFDQNWADEILEFVGPATAHAFGCKYFTLTHGGIKAEGEPYPGEKIWNEAEAWFRFKEHLKTALAGYEGQLAWRTLPTARQDPDTGAWAVTARLCLERKEPA